MKVKLAALTALLLLATSACTIRFTTTTKMTETQTPDPAAAVWLAKACALSLPVVLHQETQPKKLDEAALPELRQYWIERHETNLRVQNELAQKLETAKITSEADLKQVMTEVDAVAKRGDEEADAKVAVLGGQLSEGFQAAYRAVPACQRLK
ncbi:hypothetical protein N8J89_00990 [Crossiella sp. CA-258035]|uniref:hypothetical protein n=1 Tax=Crossiella sp. CA-258035 TaxID=2981138 RepID=UPI0024BBF47F|nr:hypothetical protein [Crossiella sp. CA-258035]WHT19700.1 hypothetical protein N8J89_00990 [Crossiella sp. CA-258035]